MAGQLDSKSAKADLTISQLSQPRCETENVRQPAKVSHLTSLTTPLSREGVRCETLGHHLDVGKPEGPPAAPPPPAAPATVRRLIGYPPIVHRSNWRKAARQARWRAHQRADQVVAPTPTSYAVITLLIDLGWLDEAKSEDRTEVGKAIGRMLEDTARRHKV